jgi:quercetin dioxygenase-like cupin family protein
MSSSFPSGRKLLIASAVLLGAALGAGALYAQQPGFKRVELQKHDVAGGAREAVLARGELNPGVVVPRHSHPGEEVAYILDGQVSLQIDGKPAETLKAGDTFFVPAGQIHTAKNLGGTPAKILSTYIVEKGKPLATPAPVK